jgi:chromosome segregation ATPase
MDNNEEFVLDVRSVEKVRFRMSKPQGYFTEDVERWIDGQLKSSLQYYQTEINELNRTNSALENSVQEKNSRIAELEMAVQFNQSNNLQEEDVMIAKLSNDNEALSLENTGLKAKIVELEESLREQTKYAEELTAWGNQAVEQGEQAIKELNQLKAQLASLDVKEDLTTYPSEEEVVVSKKAKAAKSEEDLSKANKIDTSADIGFDFEPEIDMSEISEELEAVEHQEEFDPNEFEKLPDGTIVPKGIKPEDL